MPVPLAIELVPASFHTTWSLWFQAPIVLLVLICTLRPIARAFSAVSWSRLALLLAIAAPLAVGWLLPQREYHFAGHEGAYGELLDGELPESGDLTGHRTFGVPAGLAWAMGKAAPRHPARTAWLWLNRASLALVLLCLGTAAAWTVRSPPRSSAEKAAATPPDRRRLERAATLLAVLGGLAAVPTLGWSATAFFLTPALAFGLIALLLGMSRQPASAVAWGAIAFASRMETAPLLLAGLLAVGLPGWRRTLRADRSLGAAGALLVLAWQAFVLSQKRSELPIEAVRPDPSVIWENLSMTPLGGPWLTLVVLILVGVVLALVPRPWVGRRTGLALAVGLAVALLQPALLVDVGARHLQPAVALLIPLVAAGLTALALGEDRGDAAAPRVLGFSFALLLVLALAVHSVVDLRALSHRYMAGRHAWLPAWVQAADATGARGSVADLLDDRCYVVVPGGRDTWRGTQDVGDVREIHRAALAQGAGWCVQWLVEGAAEFSGDTRAERLDRAIRTLGLEPVGWVDPSPDGGAPWLLFESGR